MAEGQEDRFEERFRNSAEKIDDREGFLRLEILRPVDAERYIILTYWESKKDFEDWTSSQEFKDAHSDLPMDMFEGKNEIEIHEVVN